MKFYDLSVEVNLTEEGRLEEGLWASESLVSNGDDLSVGKFIRLLERAGAGSGLHLLLEVQSDVAEFLLDLRLSQVQAQ